MHLFTNDDHKTKHLKIFQYKLKTILCMLDDSMQGTLNIYIYINFFQIFYITWKILASHTRLWVRRKLPLKVLSLQNMNKKNSSRRVYIPIRVHLRQNRVHWKAEGKIKERKAQVRHALGNTACISTAVCATGKRKATHIRYLLISF